MGKKKAVKPRKKKTDKAREHKFSVTYQAPTVSYAQKEYVAPITPKRKMNWRFIIFRWLGILFTMTFASLFFLGEVPFWYVMLNVYGFFHIIVWILFEWSVYDMKKLDRKIKEFKEKHPEQYQEALKRLEEESKKPVCPYIDLGDTYFDDEDSDYYEDE